MIHLSSLHRWHQAVIVSLLLTTVNCTQPVSSRMQLGDSGISHQSNNDDNERSINHSASLSTNAQPQLRVQVLGKQQWLSPTDIIKVSQEYVTHQGVSYSFIDSFCTIWIRVDRPDVLADVYFSSGFGKQVLHVVIDKHGDPVKHDLSILVDSVR